MGAEVYANNMAISCKAADGKSICAFPDVCFTPPQTPATPPGVPIPYPNTGMSSDTTDGTKNVKIGGKEVMLKNKSSFKKSIGDEAGCAPKKGLISSANHPAGAPAGGKAYFCAWSMDVKFEGENVVRNLDITTHNHSSPTANTPPWPHIDKLAIAIPPSGNCSTDINGERGACSEYKPYKKGGKDPCPGTLQSSPGKLEGDEVERFATAASKDAAKDPCVQARKCHLVPYDAPKDGINGCCPGQTPHHVIPKSSFFKSSVKAGTMLPGAKEYDPAKAPCICLEGTNNTAGTHGDGHQAHRRAGREAGFEKGELYPLSAQTVVCADAIKDIAPHCKAACLEDQIEEGHKKAGVTGNPDIKHSPSGKTEIDAGQTSAVTNKKAAKGVAGIP